MTAILLCLLASLTLAFLAGLRAGKVLHDRRRERYGGMLDLTGIDL